VAIVIESEVLIVFVTPDGECGTGNILEWLNECKGGCLIKGNEGRKRKIRNKI
jgi:hypothetical protein